MSSSETAFKLGSSVITYRWLMTSAAVTHPLNEKSRSGSTFSDDMVAQNVWLSDPQEAIYADNGSLHAGSLNHLFAELASADQYDNVYLNTFIITYKSFTTPEEMLNKLIER
jgi:hypothetical protein